jgi:hypothetical protein
MALTRQRPASRPTQGAAVPMDRTARARAAFLRDIVSAALRTH